MRYPLVLAILFSSLSAWGYNFTPQSAPQQSKIATRWSLSQWMEQKGKIQWMDLWLNSNTKSPSFYELYLGGDYAQYESTTTVDSGTPVIVKDLESWRAHAGAFVSLIGVYGQYEKSNAENREQWDLLGMLRILGHTDQGSNLTVFYGIHQQNFQLDQMKNQQVGGYLTLYIFDHLGLQGKYQHYFKDQSQMGLDVEGHRVEATAFAEWGAFRLYGTWYKEPLKTASSTQQTDYDREGFYVGLRVYLDFKK